SLLIQADVLIDLKSVSVWTNNSFVIVKAALRCRLVYYTEEILWLRITRPFSVKLMRSLWKSVHVL
ncbi:MAG: hypothetical protein UHD05_05130, partial [Ruminococcus sp.]|nr:hypothetical protein [Ruminococcus sp.]